jgi:serine/threonine protein phosphatase PrpC
MRAPTNARRDIQSRYLNRSELPRGLRDEQELPYLDAYGCTEQGVERTLNDDQFLIADLDRRMVIRQSSLPLGEQPGWRASAQGRLLVVADGISGAGASQFASRITLDAVMHHITSAMPWLLVPGSDDDQRDNQRDNQRILDDLEHVITRCELRLETVADCYGLDEPLVSTMTLAYAVWPNLYVVHAGGSRCYLFRGGRLYQLTSGHENDESWETGADDDTSSGSCPIIDRRQGHARAEVHHVALRCQDRVLLCTDGLTRHLDHHGIAHHLSANLLSANACERLIHAAREAGATDNVTVVICRFG